MAFRDRLALHIKAFKGCPRRDPCWHVRPSLLLHNISENGYATFVYLFYQFIDIWVISAFWLLWIMLLWIFPCECLHEHRFSFSLGIKLEVEFLGHMVTPWLLAFELPKCVPKWPTVLHPPRGVRGVHCPHSLANTCYQLPFSHPNGCEVGSHGGFGLHFLNDYRGRAPCPVFTGHVNTVFEEITIQVLDPFLKLAYSCFYCWALSSL